MVYFPYQCKNEIDKALNMLKHLGNKGAFLVHTFASHSSLTLLLPLLSPQGDP